MNCISKFILLICYTFIILKHFTPQIMNRLKFFMQVLIMANTFFLSAQIAFNGIIKDSENVPIEGVNLTLSTSLYAVTNAQGEFKFQNIPDGIYNLTISHIGYKTIKDKLTVNSTRYYAVLCFKDVTY